MKVRTCLQHVVLQDLQVIPLLYMHHCLELSIILAYPSYNIGSDISTLWIVIGAIIGVAFAVIIIVIVLAIVMKRKGKHYLNYENIANKYITYRVS